MSKIIEYTIQKGDTLCKIAQKFNIPVYELCIQNNITNIDFYNVGDILLIERKD